MRVGAVLVVGLLVAIAVAAGLASRGGDSPEPVGPVVVPAHATADGAIPVGQQDAPVTVTVFFDYLCPFCGRFEAANDPELDRLLQAGQARVELRPLSFLDPQSAGTEFSTRAANALATVADGAPEHIWSFHQELFREQPEEGTGGLTDEQLAGIARDAGVPDAVAERFTDRTFTGWVADVTKQAFASGVSGTPTVLVDGTVFSGDLYTPGPLTEAVTSAAADQ
jgi:protein-disulfide isomerase